MLRSTHPLPRGGSDCVQAQFVICEANLAEPELHSLTPMITEKDIVKIAAVATGAYLLKSTISRFFEYDLNNRTVLITGCRG